MTWQKEPKCIVCGCTQSHACEGNCEWSGFPGVCSTCADSRRREAFELNGDEEIPAKVYPASLTAVQVETIRTIENFGRKDLTPVERAMAVARILDQIEKTREPLTREVRNHEAMDEAMRDELWLNASETQLTGWEKNRPDVVAAIRLDREIQAAGDLHTYVGQQLGFPAKWVKDNAYIAEVGGETRALLAAHRIDVGHARELAKLGDKHQADQIADEAARNDKGLGGRDVEYVRRRVMEQLRSLRTVPWRLEVAFGSGVKDCTGQACATCKFNSKSDPDLFGGALADEPAAGFCTNGACFAAKQKIVEESITVVVAKAKAMVKRDADAGVNETSLANVIPIHVKPASAVRKAKKETEPEKSKTTDAENSSSGRRSPEDVAMDKFESAKFKWASDASSVVEAAAKKSPVRYMALAVLGCVDPFSLQWPQVTAEVVADASEIIALATGGISEIEALAKLAQKSKVRLSVFDDMPAEFYKPFIVEWGLKVSVEPKLEDFLPKPQTKKAKSA